MPWTSRQRAALCILLAAFSAWLLARACLNPTSIPSPTTAPGQRAAQLLSRVDPNTADWAALAALPGIGPSVAKRIVEYRDAFAAQHPDQPPFQTLEDLLQVKGVGPATLETLEPHLTLPRAQQPQPNP